MMYLLKGLGRSHRYFSSFVVTPVCNLPFSFLSLSLYCCRTNLNHVPPVRMNRPTIQDAVLIQNTAAVSRRVAA